MMELLMTPEVWAALGTLIALEVVLGIDNIIFISILVSRLPQEKRALARNLGLALAMLARLGLLFCLSWIMGLTEVLFSAWGHEISGRDVILVIGGLFLLAKSTHEIHNCLEIPEEEGGEQRVASFAGVLIQIALLDMVFSFDSVITAVGLVDHLSIMVIAIIVSVLVMLLAARSISNFVDANPTIKMLSLSFLLLIGFTLVAEGFGVHVPKGYIYFAMAFSVGVELLNMKMRANKRAKTIELNKKLSEVRSVEQ